MSEHTDNTLLNGLREGIQKLRAEGDDELAGFYMDLYRLAFLRRREPDVGKPHTAEAIVCRIKALRYRVWHMLALRDGNTANRQSY